MRRQLATSMTVVLVLVTVAGGCRKRPPPAPSPAAKKAALHPGPTISCPGHDELVKALAGANVMSVDCHAYNESMFWIAAALLRDDHAPDGVRLALVTGSPYAPWAIYDLVPAPTAAIKQLVAGSEEVQIHVRTGRRERRLVRIGVVGRTKKSAPDSQEVLTLLRLGAHAPPEVIWMGAGDEVTTSAGGCVSERAVDFELLFGTRTEMYASNRVIKAAADCPRGMDTQETLPARAVRLQKGRPVGGTDGGATR
jgi:hypothetical protein